VDYCSHSTFRAQVVANAVVALTEIQEAAEDEPIFVLDSQVISRLLIALGECTEWGRIAILGAVAKYEAEDEKESEHICERVIPQFQHANGSVVLAAIKVRSRLLAFPELLLTRRPRSGHHDPHERHSARGAGPDHPAQDGSATRCVPSARHAS